MAPSFSRLSEAIHFLENALATDNHAIGVPGWDEVFGPLLQKHKQQALHSLYQGRDFPADETKLTLGGHNKELGHIHIKFEKRDGAWHLVDFMQCD